MLKFVSRVLVYRPVAVGGIYDTVCPTDGFDKHVEDAYLEF